MANNFGGGGGKVDHGYKDLEPSTQNICLSVEEILEGHLSPFRPPPTKLPLCILFDAKMQILKDSLAVFFGHPSKS